MKKFMVLLLSVVMMTSLLAGCGSSSKDSSSTDAAGTASTTEGQALKIAIVSSPSGVDDGSFNEDNYNGIKAFIEQHPDATVTPVQESTGDVAAAIQAVADIVADYDVIVCCGFQFAQIGTLAEDNPETDFILVDSEPTDDEGNVVEVDNVYAMTFAEQESGFFAGMAAALESTTKKVAVVNGVAYPSNVNYQYGFESGVNYANKKYNTGVEIVELPSYAGTDVTGNNCGGNYVGSFSDVETAKVVANSLIQEGCDILFVAAGGSGTGVFTAAKEATGVKVIGCDVDQYDDGVNGSDNIVLTSALKVMSTNVQKQLNAINDGTFAGGNEVLSATTDSTGYVSTEGRCQLSAETIEKIDAAYELVKAGTIVPASFTNKLASDSFTGIDQ